MSATSVCKNGGILPLATIPRLTSAEFAALIKTRLTEGARLAACLAVPEGDGDASFTLYAVLADDQGGDLLVVAQKPQRQFDSLTPTISHVHLFEREIGEQYGVKFAGHPWFKPVRFHAPWPGGSDGWDRDPEIHPLVGDMDYFTVEGEEIHEVGVGPVHAGVIEPGHFRFQCYGEQVLHLEISLGYQHRGIEKMLLGGPWPRTAMQIETMAGDTTIGHMSAYSMVLEGLAGMAISPRARALRAIALELERLANHVGDIGALAADIGFLPTSAYCGRLRGDYLNLSAQLCGSRFGRGLVRPGGVLFDADKALLTKMRQTLEAVARNTRGAIELFFSTPSVLARLEGTGRVTARDAYYLGLVGVAGRACGIDADVRRYHGTGSYLPDEIPAMIEEGGDVLARAQVRRQEIEHSLEFLNLHLSELPAGELRQVLPPLAPGCLAVAMVEGWRGPVTHVGLTDADGRFVRYKAVDPSFFNWSGLALALRDGQISDFPLCNKSFNLSYCGFDL
ncbi:MAG: NADH-quinone oxidoreductase subunit C [Proteobacteria bacterium]|nr:NADH-quinone oxidoreductase subunit C [Pseudomonadota bacterium]MBU1714798.1 NADH-quinone oxidoreductase subunit C [Pseudomonadota bacterium]